MVNNKYNLFLTILLVVIIVAITGILVFLGINYNKRSNIAKQRDAILQQLDEFGKEDNTVTETETANTNTTANTSVELEYDKNEITSTSSGNGGGYQRPKLEYDGYRVLGKIKIPATGIEELVLDKVTTKSIESAVAVLYGPGLNKPGNTVIVGHNYRNGTLFSNNKNLQVGDKIYITDEGGTQVQYTITKKYITYAQDAEFFTRDTEGRKEISLSTCTDDSQSRLIIWAAAD